MGFPNESNFVGKGLTLPELEEYEKEYERPPVKEAKPTAQVPFGRWHNELSDVLTYADLDDATKDVIQGVTDEIYSYLRG
jgi:hypothetical protein